MADRGPCGVCDGGEDLREAVDTLLYLGRTCAEVARELEMPREFEKAVRAHLYARHQRDCTRDTYQMMISVYMQDCMKLRDRELKRPLVSQNQARINMCFKGIQWSIEQVAKMEGFNVKPSERIKGGANKLLEALNAFASENPDMVKRIQQSAERQKPVLIESKQVVEEGDEKVQERPSTDSSADGPEGAVQDVSVASRS